VAVHAWGTLREDHLPLSSPTEDPCQEPEGPWPPPGSPPCLCTHLQWAGRYLSLLAEEGLLQGGILHLDSSKHGRGVFLTVLGCAHSFAGC
jgi:hypothetical protein